VLAGRGRDAEVRDDRATCNDTHAGRGADVADDGDEGLVHDLPPREAPAASPPV